MRTMILAAALAMAATPLLATDDEPTYALTIQMDNVWGPSCIEALEKAFGRLDGVTLAKMGASKYFYELTVKETKSVLPKAIQDLTQKLEDYEYVGIVITKISGVAEKSGAGYVFTARGSNQKYQLKPNDALKKLVGDAKASVTLAGKVTQDKDAVTLEVTEAKEAK